MPFYEILTKYAKVDPGADLTVTATKVTGVDVIGNLDYHLTKLFPVDFFDALDTDFEWYCENQAVSPDGFGNIGFSNVLNDFYGWGSQDPHSGGVSIGGNVVRFYLLRGRADAIDTYIGVSATPYYATMTRVAGNDIITVKIYSDVPRTILLDTLSIAIFPFVSPKTSYG